jgi:hypothetical protein
MLDACDLAGDLERATQCAGREWLHPRLRLPVPLRAVPHPVWEHLGRQGALGCRPSMSSVPLSAWPKARARRVREGGGATRRSPPPPRASRRS